MLTYNTSRLHTSIQSSAGDLQIKRALAHQMMRPVALPYILSAFQKANRHLVPDLSVSLRCEKQSDASFKVIASAKQKPVFLVSANATGNQELKLEVEFLADLTEQQRWTARIVADSAATIIWGSSENFAPDWNQKTIVGFGIGFCSKNEDDILLSSKLLEASLQVGHEYRKVMVSLEPTPLAVQPGVDLAWVAFAPLSLITGYYHEIINICTELKVFELNNVFERLISHWEIIHQGILHPSFFVPAQNN